MPVLVPSFLETSGDQLAGVVTSTNPCHQRLVGQLFVILQTCITVEVPITCHSIQSVENDNPNQECKELYSFRETVISSSICFSIRYKLYHSVEHIQNITVQSECCDHHLYQLMHVPCLNHHQYMEGHHVKNKTYLSKAKMMSNKSGDRNFVAQKMNSSKLQN